MFARRSRALLSKISPLLPRSAVCCVWGRGLRHHRHRHRRLSAPKSFVCVCWARAPFSLLKEVKCAAKLWLHSPLPLLSLTRMQERSLAHALFSLLSLCSAAHTRTRAISAQQHSQGAAAASESVCLCLQRKAIYSKTSPQLFCVWCARSAARKCAAWHTSWVPSRTCAQRSAHFERFDALSSFWGRVLSE